MPDPQSSDMRYMR